ncbi:MAG: hypothetical protein ACRDFB_07855 [Rhabdochlamydiaceae bacterium]
MVSFCKFLFTGRVYPDLEKLIKTFNYTGKISFPPFITTTFKSDAYTLKDLSQLKSISPAERELMRQQNGKKTKELTIILDNQVQLKLPNFTYCQAEYTKLSSQLGKGAWAAGVLTIAFIALSFFAKKSVPSSNFWRARLVACYPKLIPGALLSCLMTINCVWKKRCVNFFISKLGAIFSSEDLDEYEKKILYMRNHVYAGVKLEKGFSNVDELKKRSLSPSEREILELNTIYQSLQKQDGSKGLLQFLDNSYLNREEEPVTAEFKAVKTYLETIASNPWISNVINGFIGVMEPQSANFAYWKPVLQKISSKPFVAQLRDSLSDNVEHQKTIVNQLTEYLRCRINREEKTAVTPNSDDSKEIIELIHNKVLIEIVAVGQKYNLPLEMIDSSKNFFEIVSKEKWEAALKASPKPLQKKAEI